MSAPLIIAAGVAGAAAFAALVTALERRWPLVGDVVGLVALVCLAAMALHAPLLVE